jgi:hypothetical protein
MEEAEEDADSEANLPRINADYRGSNPNVKSMDAGFCSISVHPRKSAVKISASSFPPC